MLNSKLYPVVDQPHIKVYILETSHFSIGTSPYYAHQHAIGIDIYDQLTPQNYKVLSPVAGKVLQIKELRAPKPRFNCGIDREYLTIIQNHDDKDTVFKILHVKPELYVGQKVKPGDPLGITIKSGYFAPWSSPHIHLELKKPKDVLRAKGGLSFTLNTQKEARMNTSDKISRYERIPVKICYVYDDFFLGQFPDDLYFHLTPFYGLQGNSENASFIIDGGIPQYKRGLVHLSNSNKNLLSQAIYFNTIQIGSINSFQGNYGLVDFNQVQILLNNTPLRGISLFLAMNRPFIKLIRFAKMEYKISQNSIQNLDLHKLV